METHSQKRNVVILKWLPAPNGAAMDNSTQFEQMKVNREMSV
jgi:hypothetical protein